MTPASTQRLLRRHRRPHRRGRPGGLLAVSLDQALEELVDVAGLGQVARGELVAQLGLGLALVALAGLVMGLPGLLALGLAGLSCAFLPGLLGLFGLLADGLLGLGGLLVHDVADRRGHLPHDVSGRLGLVTHHAGQRAAAWTHLTVRERLTSTIRCTRSK